LEIADAQSYDPTVFHLDTGSSAKYASYVMVIYGSNFAIVVGAIGTRQCRGWKIVVYSDSRTSAMLHPCNETQKG